MTVLEHRHHAFQFFCGEKSQALACLPFPSQDGGEDGLIVALGANLTTAQKLQPSAAQFLQQSQPSVVFNHYHSTEPGRFEDGGPLMEFANSGGQVTSICACGILKPQQDLNSCIVLGSKSGMVSALSVTVPQRSTAQVEDITVNSGIEQATGTITSSELHSGPVRAIRWMSNTDQLATAGADGKLTVHKIDAGTSGFDASAGTTLAPADPWRSFEDACWMGPNALVTAATAGEVNVWDTRVSRGAVSRSRPGWAPGARFKGLNSGPGGEGQEQLLLTRMRPSLMSLRSVAVLPSTPHACAVGHGMHGGVGGLLTAWDLRMMREPDIVPLWSSSAENEYGSGGGLSSAARAMGSTGSVIVRPDPQRAGGAAVPLVATTTDGQLFEVDLGRGGGVEVSGACRIEGGWVDVEADRTNGGTVVGCTDQQSVVIVSRQGPGGIGDAAMMVD